MLSFFRNIRKSLLASNAARKYILYAVGEVLLVMVGILLALQVNNWNEQRIVQRKINIQVASLCKDLQRDSLHLMQIINYYDNKIEVLKGIEMCYDSITTNPSKANCLDTILSVSSFFWNIKNSDKTINQLKNFGGIDILDSDDANMILDYDVLIIEYKLDELTVFQELQTSLRSIAAKLVNYGSYKGGKRVKDKSMIVDDRLILNEYFNTLNRYLFYCEANLERLKIIQEKAKIVRKHFLEKYKIND